MIITTHIITITIIIIVSIHLLRPQYKWTQIKGTKEKNQHEKRLTRMIKWIFLIPQL